MNRSMASRLREAIIPLCSALTGQQQCGLSGLGTPSRGNTSVNWGKSRWGQRSVQSCAAVLLCRLRDRGRLRLGKENCKTRSLGGKLRSPKPVQWPWEDNTRTSSDWGRQWSWDSGVALNTYRKTIKKVGVTLFVTIDAGRRDNRYDSESSLD